MLNKTGMEFSEALISKDAVPGGGGASALAGALAACLAGMVTALTSGKKTYAEYQDEIEKLARKANDYRIRLLEAINQDAQAFQPLANAYKMDKKDEYYTEVMEICLKEAASSPAHILKLCCDVVEINERLAVIGSKLAISDAATASALAIGAIYGAAINIKVNTKYMTDRSYAEKMNEETDRLVEEYTNRAMATYRLVEEKLK